ncbi:amidase [Piscinibacter sakaiensis]|uniref:amidase n=1 Tax=Piscinibacter sakaiensis TaxID=1547922 RepID=UPI003AAFF874
MNLDPSSAAGLSAVAARSKMVAGEMSATEYVQALLARVDEVEPQVQAWECLDRRYLLAQAEAADEAHAAGEPEGPLFGLPVGLKDIIDTAALPTEDGTVLHAGRMPHRDAVVVQRLIAAGGLVMGKTVTTELATYAPGKTCNPHNPAHTPGGSSSGSAAAVAAGMVPLAIGTQTNGSMIRPASFCGVYGFKPSAGLIPRTGVLTKSPAFDAVGVFGRTLDDVALLAEALVGYDEGDSTTRLQAAPPLTRMASSEAPLPPTLAWVQTPFWDRVDTDAQAAFGELLELLTGRIAPFELPASSEQAIGWHKLVMEAEIAGSFELEYERGREKLSPSLQQQIERGRKVTAVEDRRAKSRIPLLLQSLDSVFEHYDAIVTPAALGTAPRGLQATGDPVMCTLWSFLGMPSLSLPLLHGENGLPIGVQLVGRKGNDARLLRTARWLVQQVEAAA